MLILMTLTSYLESWQIKRKGLTQTLISNLFLLYRKVKLVRLMTSINSQRPAFWYRLTSCIDKMHFLKHCSRQIKLRSLMDLNTKILAIQTRLATHTRPSLNWNPRSYSWRSRMSNWVLLPKSRQKKSMNCQKKLKSFDRKGRNLVTLPSSSYKSSRICILETSQSMRRLI